MVQAFMWIPLDKPPTQKPLQSKYTPSWQWHSLMAVVTQKDNAACHSAKLSQEWPEEHEKELKVLSWHPNSPGPNPMHRTYQKTSDPWRPHLGNPSRHGLLGMSCGVWHQDIGSGCHGCPIIMESGDFGGQVNALSLTCSSGHSWAVFAVQQGALSCWGATTTWECCCHKGVYFVCNRVWVKWCMSSVVYMNTGPNVSQQNNALSQDDQ